MMFGRPRCREWTPLATQQLRLRSLIQIVGYNIRPPEWCMFPCSYYLTLHHTTMSAPFYTSERISSPHPKWKEIDSEITQCMSSTNVVIRIWCHILHGKDFDEVEKPQDAVIQTWGIYFSGLRYIGANLALNFTSDCFKSNTLVFQMHGGYFCSYKSLKLDIIPPENEIEQGSLSSDSSGKTNTSKNTLEARFIRKSIKEARSISPSKLSKRTEKEYSKSQSPVERGFKQNFPKMRMSASLNIAQSQRENYNRRRDESNERKNVDSNHIYEHSPDHLDVKEFTSSDIDRFSSNNTSTEDLYGSKIDLSETAENYDLRNESDGTPKYRYRLLNFLKSEIRPSYNATKLQTLHLLQYSIKKKQEAVKEIKEKIYKKSSLYDCWSREKDEIEVKAKLKSRSQRNLFSPDDETENLAKDKSTSQTDLTVKNGRLIDSRPMDRHISNGPRLTLKLNDLLSFKSKPSPFQRAEHVRLTKQIEILRFKRIILADERDSKLANIRRLKEIHAKLCEENQDVGSELMENYHSLSKNTDGLKESRQSCAAVLELAARSHAALANRRSDLLMELTQIFHIEQRDQSTWTICGVPLPICGDESPRMMKPVSDSVAAGYVAQATCLAASMLNQPLRYKITLLGSASKILDITADLPDPNIPLFARGGDITLFRYAMFLLNKCIAQLLWACGAPVTDMRPTLQNLHRLLTKQSNLSDTSKLFGIYKWLSDNRCPRTQSLRSMVASDRGKYRQFNRFKDAVDGQSPQTVMNLKRHRHSRSVGSYNDDQDLAAMDTSTTSIMGSEPNIYNSKLKHDNSEAKVQLKSHNSDTEISRLGTETNFDGNVTDAVIFTLGDGTCLMNLETQRLVKISSNNCDEISGNVTRICSEIEHYCSKVKNDEIPEAYDVVKHMDTINDSIDICKYMESKTTSVNNEVNCGTCEYESEDCQVACAKTVTDVIVIPSAEAMLDTGQELSEVKQMSVVKEMSEVKAVSVEVKEISVVKEMSEIKEASIEKDL